jgi:glycerophosphoryl diester phosphodiesterase
MKPLIVTALFLGSISSLHAAEPFSFFQPITPPRAVQMVANRGVAGMAPPCSRAALELAIGDQLEWIAVNVWLTKDGQHVVFPDAALDGSSDGKGRLDRWTLAELQKLDIGSWFAPRFAGQRLLTLREALEIAKGRINLLLNCHAVDPQLLVREILAAGMQRQVIVGGVREHLRPIREAGKGDVAILASWKPGAQSVEEFIEQERPAVVEVDPRQINPALVKKLHEHGVKMLASSGDADRANADAWDRLARAGVDWIQSAVPEEVLVALIRKSLKHKPVEISLHRGANRYAPENTLPAYEKAIRLQADYVEFDTRTSRDGEVFLLHDSTLNRTTNGSGPIRSKSVREIESLDAGMKFGPAFRGVSPARFEKLLETVAGKTKLYVDSKDIAPQVLVDALIKHKCVEQAIVYGNLRFLKELKKINPAIRVMPSLSRPEDLGQFGGGNPSIRS